MENKIKVTQFDSKGRMIRPLNKREKELFEMVYNLKKCVERLTSDDALTQFDKDAEAQWIGEAHELLYKVNPNYYKNANE